MNSHPKRKHLARRTPMHILEPLEIRALFSAVISVSGNTNAISSGDITPSAADFTDFGFMTTKASVLLGKLTRTFTIANTGTSTLTLTGGAKPIIISGPNAKDFTVQTLPITSIAAGTSNATTFVINFAPKGTGLRKATITIPSNDTGTPAFTFAVQGTGLSTTNFTSGLQFASVVIGTGTDKAIPGSDIDVNYTEYLMNGTNVSLLTGNTGSDFVLGIPLPGEDQHIVGWDLGMGGLKKNETRVLFVPSSLAFGSDGDTDVPANSPLIYVMNDIDLTQPLVAISGNSINIAFNDTTPSATDGTMIGTTTAGSVAPIPFTFRLTNDGGGSILYPNNNIVITGKNASAFTTTALTADTNSNFATFTVTYHPPAGAGTSNAVVNVITNDPLHPNFHFNISGVATPFQVLTATVATQNYAGPIITGATTKFTIPVKVVNNGNVAVPATPITFDVYLHNATGGTDTLISSTTLSSLKNLAVGKNTTIKLSVPIPITVDTATYSFKVKVNDDHHVTETDYSDNAPLSTQVLSMTQGFYDLATAISSTNFAAGVPVITGSTTKYTVPFTITNTGNLPIPSNAAPITFNLYAHNATSGVETLITSFSTTSLRNLAVGKAAKFSLSTTLPVTLPTASYQFDVKANENAALTESTTANNDALSGQQFNATQGFFDLYASLGISTTLPVISGSGTLEKVQLFIGNSSNLTIPSNAAPISINIYAHNATSGDNTLISSINTTAMRNLKVGQTTPAINLSTTVPIAIPTGTFQLLVTINENNGITESLLANNSAQSDSIFNVTQGVNNITGNLSTSTFATTIAHGVPISGKLTFAVQNAGNLTLPSSQKVVAQVVAVADDDTLVNIGSAGTISVGSFIAGKAATFSLTKTLVSGLTAGTYHFAVLLTVPGLTQSTSDDLLEQTAGLATFDLMVT